MIRSMIFTIAACTLTYALCQKNEQTLMKVDLQKVLKEKALGLSLKDMSKDMLEMEMIKAQKNIGKILQTIAQKNKAIIVTSPTFGDVLDVSETVIKMMEEKQ